MIAFSTSWNSGRHTDGAEMLREIKELGFNRVELGHGIRISLMPGIQKMFEAGAGGVTGLDKFFSLSGESLQASPDCSKIFGAYFKESNRAGPPNFPSIEFCAS